VLIRGDLPDLVVVKNAASHTHTRACARRNWPVYFDSIAPRKVAPRRHFTGKNPPGGANFYREKIAGGDFLHEIILIKKSPPP